MVEWRVMEDGLILAAIEPGRVFVLLEGPVVQLHWMAEPISFAVPSI